MQLNQLKRSDKKQTEGIQSIRDYTRYRLRRTKQHNNMNYKDEYDRLVGELSQTTVTQRTRDRIERRMRDIDDAYQGSQYIKDILLP